MKKSYLLPALAVTLGLASCSQNRQPAESSAGGPATDSARVESVAPTALAAVQPVDLPDPHIPGYHFPEPEATIDQWVQAGDAGRINLHGWGIWTALTTPTAQVQGADTLRVFETWTTPEEIAERLQQGGQKSANALQARQARPLRRRLRTPRQFFRDEQLVGQLKAAHAANNAANDSNAVFESVYYSPAAAQHTFDNKLLLKSTLNELLAAGKTEIPTFPSTAVAVKPVYEVVPGPRRSRGLYRMKVWANIPPALSTNPQAFPQREWTSCVFVDVRNRGRGNGQVLKGCGPATPQTTYNLRDFVYHSLTAEEAQALYEQAKHDGTIGPNVKPYAAGDYAILVAMHITSREIQRWTWQTVWWAPNPEQVPAPSAPAVVAARPKQLRGAPRHYGMAIAYQMLTPAQPLTGGNNRGTSIYVYNPYLEAPFSPSTFDQKAEVVTNGVVVVNNVGMRTNCMSCHGQANYNPQKLKTGLGYVGDTYVDMNAPGFKGTLKVDFLWSINDDAVATSPAAQPAQ
jgi:hypothetical protein